MSTAACGVLVAGLEASLVPGGDAAAPQLSASHSSPVGRRQPAHQLWWLLCLESDACDGPPDVLLPGTCSTSKALGEQMLQGEKGRCMMHIRAGAETERLNSLI